jgi:hypothetical protein
VDENTPLLKETLLEMKRKLTEQRLDCIKQIMEFESKM